jgi:hypothetical protein
MTKLGRSVRRALAMAIIGFLLGPAAMRPWPQTTPQEPPPREIQRPSYDYMSTFLSRSTHPLGIKEDPAARRMLGQGAVPWAMRAASRHVLD